MKKILALTLALIMCAFCFASCGQTKDDEETKTLTIGYTLYEPMNYEENGELVAEDGHTYIDTCLDEGNLMEFVFCDGKMEKEYSLKDIRDRLHGGKF